MRKKRLKKNVHRSMNRRLKGCKKSKKGLVDNSKDSKKKAE